MSDQKENINDKELDWLLTGAVLLVAALLAAYSIAASWAGFSFSLNPRDWEAFAGFFNGMATPVMSLFALYVLAKTLRVNQQELSETRKQLEAAAIAQKDLVELERNRQRLIHAEQRFQSFIDDFEKTNNLPDSEEYHYSNLPESVQDPNQEYVICFNAKQVAMAIYKKKKPVINIDSPWKDSALTRNHIFGRSLMLENGFRIFIDAYDADNYRQDWASTLLGHHQNFITMCDDTQTIMVDDRGNIQKNFRPQLSLFNTASVNKRT